MTGAAWPSESVSPARPQARRWLDLAAVERPVLDLRPDYTALIIVAEELHPGPDGRGHRRAAERRRSSGLGHAGGAGRRGP